MTTVEFPAGVDSVPVMGLHFMREPVTAKSYNQDGLVAMWDGIENAGWGEHDASAATWKNLKGSDDLIVTSSGVWSDDGLDNFSTAYRMAYRDSFSFAAPLTQEIVFHLRGMQPGSKNGVMLHISQWYSGNSMLRGVHYSTYAGSYLSLKTYPSCRGFGAIFNPVSVSSIYDSGGVTETYVNGEHESLVSGTLDNWWANDAQGVNLGNREANNRGSYLKIFAIRFYSRALTASEIAANCAIDRERFSLP